MRVRSLGVKSSGFCSSSSLFEVDNLHNTAGDIALSMNNEKCYRVIRDAGIRSGEPN